MYTNLFDANKFLSDYSLQQEGQGSEPNVTPSAPDSDEPPTYNMMIQHGSLTGNMVRYHVAYSFGSGYLHLRRYKLPLICTYPRYKYPLPIQFVTKKWAG